VNHALGSVEPNHLTNAVAEVVLRSLRQVVHRVAANVQRASGYFVQVRLPDVGAGALDESDLGLLATAQAVAQFGRKRETGRAAADNDNLVQRGVRDPYPIGLACDGGGWNCY
jgi:hypothetical protein